MEPDVNVKLKQINTQFQVLNSPIPIFKLNNKIETSNRPITSVIFNYSSFKLTKAMTTLLNRGLNFSLLPLKLDITQLLVDYKKFERSTIWHEFWFGRENGGEEYKPPIFKTNKRNLPKNYTVPIGLKTFLGAVKSELLDYRNRNPTSCNISPEEIEALSELISLQRQRQIIIKACDKGAGIMILDFDTYLKACYEHLTSTQIQEDGSHKSYYTQIPEFRIERAKTNIKHIIQEGLRQEILSIQEFQEMDPSDKEPARFYSNFKVHKKHTPMTAPPPRPIISGSGSITENIGLYVEYHIKDLIKSYPSILEDTPDFLRSIEREINQGPRLSDDSILVSIDVQALFTNIPHIDGLDGLRIALNKRERKERKYKETLLSN